MSLPEGFVYSQSSLQDYADCPRRFQLRYLKRCRWPAPETADALEFERTVRQGHAFHRMLHQFYSGIPAGALGRAAAVDRDLARWWANHQSLPPQGLPAGVCEPETTLSITVAAADRATQCKCRVEARYDLLAGEPGARWMIVDWKTGRRHATRACLSERLQTRIYPLVLIEGGTAYNGGLPIPPGQVEMLYWFAEFPEQPERFDYSKTHLDADTAYLKDLLLEIERRTDVVFPLTENRRLCRFCVYRSLCWEDVQAGCTDDMEDVEGAGIEPEVIDLESIAPIPF